MKPRSDTRKQSDAGKPDGLVRNLSAEEVAQRRMADTHAAILDALPANVALLNEEGTILAVNESWEKFGLANAMQGAAFFVGRNYLQICEQAKGVDEEEARAAARGIRQVIAGELGEFNLEYSCHSPQEQRWFQLMVSPLRAEGLIGAVAMHVNITQRHLMEQALLVSEREQRRLAEQLDAERARLLTAQAVAKIGSWETDLQTLEVIWTVQTHQIFETKPEEFKLTHEGFLTLIHPDDRARVDAEFNRSMQDDSIHIIEHRVLFPNDRMKRVEERWQIFRDAGGKPIRAVGTSRDVTAKRNAELGLKHAAAMSRMAERLAHLGAWAVDLQTNTIEWSDLVYRVHGVTEGHLPTLQEALDFFVPEHRPIIKSAVEKCASEGTAYELELQITNTQGRKVWVATLGEAVRDDAGRIVKLQGAMQDIDKTKRAEIAVMLSHDRLAVVIETLQEITTVSRNFDDAIKRVADRACRISGGQGATVELLSDGKLRMQYGSGLLAGIGRPGDVKLGPFCGSTMSCKAPLVSNDAQHDKRFDRQAMRERGIHSIMVTSLREGDHCIGFLTVVADRPDAFDAEALANLQILSEALATVIQRHNFTEKLRASEQQYRLLFASNPFPMWAYDVATLRFLDVNDAAMIHYGYSRTEFLEMTLPDILALQDPTGLNAALQNPPTEGSLSGLRVHRKKSGEEIQVEASSEPLIFNGRSARLALAQDVTERRRNHSRLLQQAALIDAAPVAIFVQDSTHRVTFWSKGAEKLYGWSAEEALGMALVELLNPDPGKYEEAVRRSEQEGQWSGEVKKHNKACELLVVAGQWQCQKNDQGEVESILTIDIDITAQKKIEQQFLRAQRMESIGTLAGGIAHDLNNLLSPIVMGVELLRLSPQTESSTMVIGNIERSARRGTDLVKQVLSFARGVEGARVAVKLNHIVRDIQNLIESTFPKNIRCQTELPNDLPLIMGDPTQLHQVILNLAVNARDAMPMGGDITISAKVVVLDKQYAVMNHGMIAGKYVCLNFVDSGGGIPPEVVDRIFEPFFTTKEMNKGTGLGLSTAMGIVRSHGGFINVYSEPDKGTSFKVYLPVQLQLDSDSEAETSLPEALIRGHAEMILVVDDEISILSITKQTLEAFGYRVLTAEDGAQAIGIYATHRDQIKLVLTDMMMPVMDGPSLIVAIKRIDPHARIVAASGLNTNGYIAKVTASGVTNFLPKPYSAESMLQMLHKVLQE